MQEYITYFTATQKEINLIYRIENPPSKSYLVGSAAEMAAAYLISAAFPITAAVLAVDGGIRLLRKITKKEKCSEGLVGIVREAVGL
jgi:hypothetical protein